MKYLILLFFSFIVFSCQPNIATLDEILPPKLVMWCLLHPDSLPTAYIGQTSPVLSKSDRKVSDALVILYENNKRIDTLIENEKGVYQSKKQYKLREGELYKLTVDKNGFDKIESPTDTMPVKPVILETRSNDSAVFAQDRVLASIEFKTNKPSNFDTDIKKF